MPKQISFNDNDEELIKQIEAFQKAHDIRYFVEAVRVLCKNGLSMSNVVKNLNQSGGNKPLSKIWLSCMVISLIVILSFSFMKGFKSGPEIVRVDGTRGRCLICGKEGSFQMDGGYYCFKHYNERLFG